MIRRWYNRQDEFTQIVVSVFVWAVILVSIGGGVMYYFMPTAEQRQQQRQAEYNYHYQRGYDANKAGVPATANPNKPGLNATQSWLDGWMAANTEGKK